MITIWSNKFPTEAQLIGNILTSYGELEFSAATALAVAMKDSSTAFRLMFRLRNEGQRLEVFNTMMYPTAKTYGLDAPYSHVIGALRTCKSIRNRYAHSHWYHDEKTVSYCNMEEAAEASETEPMLTFTAVNLNLLREEVDYFSYCDDGLLYLTEEIRRKDGTISSHAFQEPKQRRKPGQKDRGS